MSWISLDPYVCVRTDPGGGIRLAFGSGSERRELSCSEPLVVGWLLAFRVPTSIEEARERAERILGVSGESAQLLVANLAGTGLLRVTEEVSDPPPPSPSLQRWLRWGWRDALDFHLAVRDLEFLPGDEFGWATQLETLDEWMDQADASVDEPSPGPYKEIVHASTITLPRSRSGIDRRRFGDVLHARRTCRTFDGSEVPFASFAELLEHAAGKTGELAFGRTGTHIVRSSPSGGARHPVEVYAVAVHVEGVPPGVYHYSVKSHALESIRPGDHGETLWDLSHRQNGMKNVSAAFFFTARWSRHMWKYRYARSYRMVLFDVAHLVQTQLLVATALGLRTFLTPAVKDSLAGQFLGIEDDLDESVLYVTSIG